MTKKEIEAFCKLAKEAGILKRIRRTGWVRIGVQNPESVADHSFRTALLSMILGKERRVDQQKLIEMALIHDLGETATSDIRYEEGKNIIGSEQAKHQLEGDVLKRIFKNYPKGDHYLNLWYEFRDQSSKEAKLLKQIEKLEMALQALEYQELGTNPKSLNEFFENADKYIKDPEIKNIFKVVLAQRRTKWKT